MNDTTPAAKPANDSAGSLPMSAVARLNAYIAMIAVAKRPASSATVGDRVRWDGDMANAERSGEIVKLESHHMWIRWDGADRDHVTMRSLLDGPRWHLLAPASK